MPWITSFFAAAIASGTGALLAGIIANACVSWYQLSYSDGASGLLAGWARLIGGLAGFVIGLIAARASAAYYGSGFVKEAAGALGAVLLIAGLSAARLRWSADIAPTLDGDPLMLEVEFRFPNRLGGEAPPTAQGDDWQMTLVSYADQPRRSSRTGEIRGTAARHEDGQWIVPTQIELTTARDKREVMLDRQHSTHVQTFELPLPARPLRTHEAWSVWIPERQANGQPWPPDSMSYRFRVRKFR